MIRLAASNADSPGPRHPVQTAIRLVLAVAFTLVGSAVLTVLLLHLSAYGPERLHEWVLGEPVKIMRRLMVAVALPMLPVVIRAAGGARWRDAGWSATDAERLDPRWTRDLTLGLGLGLLTLGLAVFLSYVTGGRVSQSVPFGRAIQLAIPIIVSASVIGLLEETAVRGFMLHILRRPWTFWAATLVTSLLFAWGHYVEPQAAAFEVEGTVRQVSAVLVSSLTHPARVPHFLPRFVNLALMGGVLCISVRRFGTVWMAVGLHTGWVIVKKLNGRLGNVDRAVSTLPWIGQRSDAIDGWLTAVLLLCLGAVFLFPASRRNERSATL